MKYNKYNSNKEFSSILFEKWVALGVKTWNPPRKCEGLPCRSASSSQQWVKIFFYRAFDILSILSHCLFLSNHFCKGHTLISLITVEVGINVLGCKSCKINWTFSLNFWARFKIYSSKWLWEKWSLGSVRILKVL